MKIEYQVPKEVKLIDLHNYCMEKDIEAIVDNGVTYLQLLEIEVKHNV